MNKSCKEYIKEIKAMFPIKGRAERKYIKELSKDVEEYCEDAGVISRKICTKITELPLMLLKVILLLQVFLMYLKS